MTRICHLFDGSTGWEQRLGVSHLLERLCPDRFVNRLVTIAPAALPHLRRLHRPVEAVHALAGLTATVAPSVNRFLAREQIELVHAWGLPAALSARAGSRMPLVIELFDPRFTRNEIKLVRTLARSTGFAVACSTATVRRRLIEGGVAPELCVVVRPGVDFALINRGQDGSLREQLGIRRDEYVVIIPEPTPRDGGHLEGYWAVELMNHSVGNVRIIVPGRSREQRRISRLDATGLDSRVVVNPGDRFPFEELVPISDALVVIPQGDIPTTCIAWAMAANVAVIGTAVHAVAELIANQVNGLLFKPNGDESPAMAVARLLQDRAGQARIKETARGQAYEVFGMRRYVDQHIRLYQNVLSGVAPSEGLVDSSLAT